MKEIILLQTHVDYKQNTDSLDISFPEISIFGKTLEGVPVQVKINDFLPYFYAQCAPEIHENDLEKVIQGAFTKGKCLGVDKVYKQNIYGYSTEKKPFFKIFFNSPLVFRSARAMLEQGLFIDREPVKFKTFESNFPFVLRFMNDLKIDGMTYIKINNFVVKSTMPFIISTSHEFVEQLPISGEYMKILPLKIVSIDIECCSFSKAFPVAQKDPVIQIGNTTQLFGSEETKKDIFCLKETAPIPGATVHWFETEKEMLESWYNFIIKEDPDIIIGYNIKSFDFPYLLERAEILKIKDFAKLGRTDSISRVISKQQSSSAFGSFDAKEIIIEGRFVFDLLHMIRRDYKLRSYSLNAVSFHFLGEQKEDVPYSSIYQLQHESKETRKRIASYCLRDTYLPLRIFDKLNILINYCELARATHVPLDYFLNRGSSIKVLSQIYREASAEGFLIPDIDAQDGESSFEGGFVMEPLKGYYSEPIAVLDFTSLYPSIMISKNLCYSTLMTKSQFDEVGGIQTPTNNYFCKVEQKEGLLPRIFKNLLNARKETKKLLKMTEDPILKRSLDGRQLALKICANSIYGFTGSTVGQLPCIEISQSTTAFGRDMIADTKRLIEDNFNKQRGFTHNSQVIYGDTDSVMIDFKEKDLKQVFKMAKEIAAFVSDKFEKPVSLEFEKVYFPYLLMNKKRYAGLIYTNPEKPDKIDTKGIETVRRDNCELVKNTIQICLNKILLERDVEGAKQYVKDVVRDLYLERVDLNQLVISKTYTKTNYTSKQPHVELVEKLKKRGLEVGIGERIEYVIVKGDKKMLASEKSEDPVYVLDNNLPIDTEYYIEQQLSNPVHRLFEPIMGDVSVLFHGEHTKVMSRTGTVNGPMNAFIKTTDECLHCKKPGKIICDNCKLDFPKIYSEYIDSFNNKTDVYNKCWSECQRCQGSLLNEVLCINRICPIWYKRTKVKKDISTLQEKIKKLQNFSW